MRYLQFQNRCFMAHISIQVPQLYLQKQKVSNFKESLKNTFYQDFKTVHSNNTTYFLVFSVYVLLPYESIILTENQLSTFFSLAGQLGVVPMSMPLRVFRKMWAISPPRSTSCALPGGDRNTGVRFLPKVIPIGPKWDKSGTF